MQIIKVPVTVLATDDGYVPINIGDTVKYGNNYIRLCVNKDLLKINNCHMVEFKQE